MFMICTEVQPKKKIFYQYETFDKSAVDGCEDIMNDLSVSFNKTKQPKPHISDLHGYVSVLTTHHQVRTVPSC